jgi:hypothetical protein
MNYLAENNNLFAVEVGNHTLDLLADRSHSPVVGALRRRSGV